MSKKISFILVLCAMYVSPVIANESYWGVGVASVKNDMKISDEFVAFTGATFSEQTGSANLTALQLTYGRDVAKNVYVGGVIGFGFSDVDTISIAASANNNNLNMDISTEVGFLTGAEARYNFPISSSFELVGSLGYYFIKINSYIEYSGPTGNGYVEAADDDNGLGYGLGMKFNLNANGSFILMYNDYPDLDLGFNSEYALQGFSLMFQNRI